MKLLFTKLRFWKNPGPQIKEPEKKTTPYGGSLQKPSKDELENHVPKLEMQYYDPESGKAMDPKQVISARSQGILKPIFYNPYQDLDYIIIESIAKHTVIAGLLNTFTQFIVGTGFKPELELVNPTGDESKDQKELKKHQNVIEELNKITRQIDRSNDIPFKDYITMGLDSAMTFGRSALIYDMATSYKGIPTTLKYAHPRDLSITTFYDSWRLQSVLWRHQTGQTVPADSMIYLWNPLATAKFHNAWQYGGSMITGMLHAAKTLRTIISEDFPAMAKTTWAGSFFLVARNQGNTRESKTQEWKDFTQNMRAGGPNVVIANPEDIDTHQIDYNPKVQEFQDLAHFLIKYCCANLGLPSSMFFDESDSNRSAARTKMQSVVNTTIAPIRERFSAMICRQSYQKWFEQLYPDLVDTVQIRLKFDDLKISEWYDRIEAALRVDSRHELTHEAFGKLADLPNYINQIKPNAETIPGGQGEKPHNIQRDNSGKNLDMGVSKNKEGLE